MAPAISIRTLLAGKACGVLKGPMTPAINQALDKSKHQLTSDLN